MRTDPSIWSRLTSPRLLFAETIAFLISATAVGFAVNLLEEPAARLLAAGIAGVPLSLLLLWLAVGFGSRIVLTLRQISKEKGDLKIAYRNDRFFRTSANNTVTCLFDLATAFIHFVSSFVHNRFYLLSVSAVGFLVFAMKLYLITNGKRDGKHQGILISVLLFLMAAATSGSVLMLILKEATPAPKGLVIYWNALYAFLNAYLAVSGLIRAAKAKNATIGRFLSVKLANAAFGMLTLAVSMLATFSDPFDGIKLWYALLGAGAFAVIFGVGSVLFVQSLRKQR